MTSLNTSHSGSGRTGTTNSTQGSFTFTNISASGLINNKVCLDSLRRERLIRDDTCSLARVACQDIRAVNAMTAL